MKLALALVVLSLIALTSGGGAKHRSIREIFRDMARSKHSAIVKRKMADDKVRNKRFLDIVLGSDCGAFGCNGGGSQDLGSQGWNTDAWGNSLDSPSQNVYNNYGDDDDDYYYYDDDEYYYDDEDEE